MKCETCLYNKNCQFLAKHPKAIVEGCTAYKDARNMVEVVKCQDCQYSEIFVNKGDELYCLCNLEGNGICRRSLLDFCSYGERKKRT